MDKPSEPAPSRQHDECFQMMSSTTALAETQQWGEVERDQVEVSVATIKPPSVDPFYQIPLLYSVQILTLLYKTLQFGDAKWTVVADLQELFERRKAKNTNFVEGKTTPETANDLDISCKENKTRKFDLRKTRNERLSEGPEVNLLGSNTARKAERVFSSCAYFAEFRDLAGRLVRETRLLEAVGSWSSGLLGYEDVFGQENKHALSTTRTPTDHRNCTRLNDNAAAGVAEAVGFFNLAIVPAKGSLSFSFLSRVSSSCGKNEAALSCSKISEAGAEDETVSVVEPDDFKLGAAVDNKHKRPLSVEKRNLVFLWAELAIHHRKAAECETWRKLVEENGLHETETGSAFASWSSCRRKSESVTRNLMRRQVEFCYWKWMKRADFGEEEETSASKVPKAQNINPFSNFLHHQHFAIPDVLLNARPRNLPSESPAESRKAGTVNVPDYYDEFVQLRKRLQPFCSVWEKEKPLWTSCDSDGRVGSSSTFAKGRRGNKEEFSHPITDIGTSSQQVEPDGSALPDSTRGKPPVEGQDRDQAVEHPVRKKQDRVVPSASRTSGGVLFPDLSGILRDENAAPSRRKPLGANGSFDSDDKEDLAPPPRGSENCVGARRTEEQTGVSNVCLRNQENATLHQLGEERQQDVENGEDRTSEISNRTASTTACLEESWKLLPSFDADFYSKRKNCKSRSPSSSSAAQSTGNDPGVLLNGIENLMWQTASRPIVVVDTAKRYSVSSLRKMEKQIKRRIMAEK
ncbi:unnamed protein product [Amoebophrya sp. A120]|nr:unnamed protein product [Amoebophrya sp. A120]|eukprot:GSA120T00019191001.1